MTVEQYLIFARYAFIAIIIYNVFLLVYIFDTRPDKETRKRIKDLAKEKNVMQHIIINSILKNYFKAYDAALIQQIHIENNQISFDEWKQANQTNKQTRIVKPRKKHPEK